MSSAGRNDGISGMGHSSSLTSMSSAGLGGRVVTERGLGIMAASRLLSVSGRRRYGRYACRRSRCDVVRRAVVEAETAACLAALPGLGSRRFSALVDHRPSQSALPWKRPKGLASFHERSRGLIQEIFLWRRSADEAAMRHAN